MPKLPGDDNEILRVFNEMIAQMDTEELGAVAHQLLHRYALGDPEGTGGARAAAPELRRPRLDDLRVYRVRIDLDYAKPPIWRRLVLRSDLTLDRVHDIIQAAFGWWDTHLHTFALGARPFSPGVQRFLCPFDVEEEGGIPASEVRLDETLQEVGDELFYLYDYGDNWGHTIKLEEVTPASPETREAVCTGGKRAAPPEDCGSLRTAEELAEVLLDPTYFNVEEVNAALADTNPLLAAQAELLAAPRSVLETLPARLVELIEQGRFAVEEDLTDRFHALTQPVPEVDIAEALAPLTAFLRYVGTGIPMTAKGYLRPADVRAAAEMLPVMNDWIFAIHREIDTHPVWDVREATQSLGLTRKYRGELRCTRAGTHGSRDPQLLWAHLAERLIKPHKDVFTTNANLLALFLMATGETISHGDIAAILAANGWRTEGYRLEVAVREATSDLDAIANNLTGYRREKGIGPALVSPAARALARAALDAHPGDLG